MADLPTFDLFVSYAEADAAWVEGYLLDALTKAGVRTHSEAAFILGAPRLTEFERAVRSSQRTLLVLSPAYLADDYAAFVDVLAQTFGLETGTWPVIPLVLHAVELPTRLALLVRLEATDSASAEAAVERLLAELPRPVPAPAPPPACPYPGMRPFTAAEAPLFHGREAETEELVRRLHVQLPRDRRFLAVIGPSGSGKSSLVFAGLIPSLRQSGLFGPGSWTVVSVRPGSAPMAAPSTLLGSEGPQSGPAFADLIAAPPPGRLLLIVDQFEELFTVSRDQTPEDEQPFQDTLAKLATAPDSFVVLTARADFYPDLMASPLWPLVQAHRAEVLPLGKDGLRRAIVKPAERVGVYVEAALVERLAADAAGEPGVLPLVQQTLVLLWERLERRFLPLRAYEALVLPRLAYGGVGSVRLGGRTGLEVAVATHADAVLAELTPPQQAIARRLFLRLVQFGEGRAHTRRQRPVAELRSVGENPADFEATIEHLAANRLLTLGGGEAAGERTVDLAHEALIGGWPWLEHLLVERREAVEVRQRLEDKAREWGRLGRGQGGLLDEAELAEAERWLTSPDAAELGYGEDLPALVAASRAELAREVRRLRTRLYGAVAFGGVALITAIIAFAFFQQARENELLADERAVEAVEAQATAEWRADVSRAQALAALAPNQHELDEDERGALLAREAYLVDEAAGGVVRGDVDQALRTVLAREHFTQRLAHEGEVQALAYSPNGAILATGSADGTARLWNPSDPTADPVVLPGHESVVHAVAFSPDGTTLATGSLDGPARLWDLTALEAAPLVLHGHEGGVLSVAFSPDGTTLATGSTDGTARLWNLSDRTADPVVLRGHAGWVHAVAFSPDGTTLATGGDLPFVAAAGDDTARLWNLRDPAANPILIAVKDDVLAIAFSPDGTILTIGSGDGTVQLWDPSDLTAPSIVLRGHNRAVGAVAYSRDGTNLATGSFDDTVRLWDLDRPRADPIVLSGHESWINAVAFGPEGTTLATSSGGDSTAWLWDLGQPEAALTVIELGEGNTSEDVAFSPNGSTLATGSSIGMVRLWDPSDPTADPVVFSGHEGGIGAVAFSPDGTTLATGSLDTTVRLWDPTDPTAAPIVLRGHEHVVNAIAFSPGGTILATGSYDHSVRLWDSSDPTANPVVLRGHSHGVNAVAFSPDGSILATGSFDHTVRIWEVTDPTATPTVIVLGGEDWANALAFSPDGTTFATGNRDGTVRLWDPSDPAAAPVVLRGHENGVNAVAFSPDGTTLASGGDDGTLRLWSLSHLEADPVVLRGNERWVYAVAFSPDGTTLAASSGGYTVRLIVPTRVLAEIVCSQVRRNLTLDEWQQFVGPDVPYRPTCPHLPPGKSTFGGTPLAEPMSPPVLIGGEVPSAIRPTQVVATATPEATTNGACFVVLDRPTFPAMVRPDGAVAGECGTPDNPEVRAFLAIEAARTTTAGSTRDLVTGVELEAGGSVDFGLVVNVDGRPRAVPLRAGERWSVAGCDVPPQAPATPAPCSASGETSAMLAGGGLIDQATGVLTVDSATPTGRRFAVSAVFEVGGERHERTVEVLVVPVADSPVTPTYGVSTVLIRAPVELPPGPLAVQVARHRYNGGSQSRIEAKAGPLALVVEAGNLDVEVNGTAIRFPSNAPPDTLGVPLVPGQRLSLGPGDQLMVAVSDELTARNTGHEVADFLIVRFSGNGASGQMEGTPEAAIGLSVTVLIDGELAGVAPGPTTFTLNRLELAPGEAQGPIGIVVGYGFFAADTGTLTMDVSTGSGTVRQGGEVRSLSPDNRASTMAILEPGDTVLVEPGTWLTLANSGPDRLVGLGLIVRLAPPPEPLATTASHSPP
jgi:WD40 repeat protein